jgi:starvation-inducible DNA-binding protein
MSPNIGIAESERKKIVTILNTLLADEYMLYTKTRNYHWNVIGPQFNDLHKFFEGQYGELNEVIDDVAERARTLGGAATATLTEFRDAARLKEHPGQYPAAEEMLANLLGDHETVIRQLRDDVDTTANGRDAGTSDFLTGLMEKHEKMAWMLRAFAEGKTSSRSR